MARKTKKQKLEEQRIRQIAVRDEAREKRRPGRDDMARTLLWLMMREAHADARRQQSRARLDMLCALLVTNLELQGFDANEAESVFEMLESKYRTQASPGRIKRHLGQSDDHSTRSNP